MKKIKGSALVDYLVPTLIIGAVAGMGIYTIQSSGVLKNFISASLNIDVGDDGKGVVGETVATNDTIATITPPAGINLSTLKAGDLGGTAEQPVKSCVGNDCAIDFGDVILTGVPENFGALVSTNGSNIGTSTIGDLMMQLANQIDDPATPEDEGSDLRDLANLGHFVARNIEEAEEKIKVSCQFETTNCIDTLYGDYLSVDADFPANLSGVITNKNYSVAAMLIQGSTDGPSTKLLGQIRSLKNEGSVLYDMHTDSHPLYAIIEEFDKVQNNSDPRYTDTVKSITNQLFLDLDRVIFDFQERNHSYADPGFAQSHKSPITGIATGEEPSYTVGEKTDYELAQEILHPQSSMFTDIDSALICTTGKHDDTGKACNTK